MLPVEKRNRPQAVQALMARTGPPGEREQHHGQPEGAGRDGPGGKRASDAGAAASQAEGGEGAAEHIDRCAGGTKARGVRETR